MPSLQKVYKRGKLLLTAEYLVLDGAQALALPTKAGQSFTIVPTNEDKLIWTALLNDGSVWFTASFDLPLEEHTVLGNGLAKTLFEILIAAQTLNPNFLKSGQGYEITSELDFEKDWGLGSSSTLISFIASWAAIDKYELLETTFGGSGYDLACADASKPLLYSNKTTPPEIESVSFDPKFKNRLHFVYLNQKQNSRESIAHYRATPKENIAQAIQSISILTENILSSQSLEQFETTLLEHERLISSVIKTARIQDQLFSDYDGVIKSLGGWGGDFILVTGTTAYVKKYFTSKGLQTIIPYEDMIL